MNLTKQLQLHHSKAITHTYVAIEESACDPKHNRIKDSIRTIDIGFSLKYNVLVHDPYTLS